MTTLLVMVLEVVMMQLFELVVVHFMLVKVFNSDTTKVPLNNFLLTNLSSNPFSMSTPY